MELEGKAIGILLGGVDEFLERSDKKAVPARTEPLKNWKDYGRIGMTAFGLGLEAFMPKYARWGKTLGEVGLAFLTKSVSKVIIKETTAAAPAVTYIGRREGVPVSHSAPVSRSYQPEFEGILAI